MTEKVTELLKKKNLDAILISDGYNMRYLSGFGGATGYLYISADQKVLMTDSRYTTQAKHKAFALTGRLADCHHTQGDALG